MTTRFIISLCLLTALISYAGNTPALRDSDTGASFDLSVPYEAETQVQEYNSQWLDSVPYLLEHARWKEPWAYEALGDCYRYGKGGVEKNMLSALIYYDEAGGSARKKAENAYTENPYDELGLMDHIMDNLIRKQKSENDIILLLEDPDVPQSAWIGFLREILSHEGDSRIKFIQSALNAWSSPDEFLIGMVFLSKADKHFVKKTLSGLTDNTGMDARILTGKLKPLYDEAGRTLWVIYEAGDKAAGDTYLRKALEYMYLADQNALLSVTNMARILTYCEENGITDLPPFSKEDLSRFDTLCPNEHRDYINSPVVVEEVVEEIVEEEAAE